MNRNKFVFAAFVGTIAVPLLLWAADRQPKAPARLCIDDTERCASTPDPQAGVKWHPGYYLKTTGRGGNTAQLAKVQDSASILGVDVLYMWAQLEPTQGNYDFSSIDTDLNWLKSKNRRLIITVMDRKFATTVQTGFAPDYLQDNVYQSTTGFGIALWRPAVMDRLIALTQAICERYDMDPAVEIIRAPNEVSPALNLLTQPTDYSRSGLAAQLMRFWDASKTACPHTIVSAMVNNLSGEATELIEHAYQIGIGFGTPDAYNDIGHRLFAGTTVSGESIPLRDYRGTVAHYTIGSNPVLGGRINNGPATNIISFCQTNKCTHLSWNSGSIVPGNTWPDILSAIAAHPMLYTACPTQYKSCNRS